VDHAEAHELGLLEAGNHAQHARLFAHLSCVWKPTRLK
jgi:hypothetical protein